MQRFQGYKFELMPTGAQQRQMRCFAGSCRFVFNKALAMQRERHERGAKRLGFAAMCKLVTAWRSIAETAWLQEAPRHALDQALMDLDRAYVNFFTGRADAPRFKRKGQDDGFRFPDREQIKLDQSSNRVRLPKLGWIRYRNSRPVRGTIKSATVSEYCGKWYVSILTERDVQQPRHDGTTVGLSIGGASFATVSDGSAYGSPGTFAAHETSLRKAQQNLRRKSRFSNNWKKAIARLQRVHARVANVRRDYLHKTSATISKKHAIVYVEDLPASAMSLSECNGGRSAGVKTPTRSGLYQAILERGQYEFRRQLEYKLAWNGGRLIVVPPLAPLPPRPCCRLARTGGRAFQHRERRCARASGDSPDLADAINVHRAGHARCACEVSGGVVPPATGTHRSDPGSTKAEPGHGRSPLARQGRVSK